MILFIRKFNKRIKYIFSLNFIQFLFLKNISKLFWGNRKKILFRNYNCIKFSNIDSIRKSESVYIFGSGYSFNKLSKAEIKHIEKHDVITFNWGHFQEKFHPIIHLSRRIGDWNSSYYDNSILNNKWQKAVHEYFDLLEKNKFYKNTKLSIQWEPICRGSRYAVIKQLINNDREIIPYSTDYKNICNLCEDNILSHKNSTLTSAINIAAKCGWKNIILTCINLDQGYFWLKKNKTTAIQMKKSKKTGEHSTVDLGIKETILKIKNKLDGKNINLYRHKNSNGLIDILDIYPK